MLTGCKPPGFRFSLFITNSRYELNFIVLLNSSFSSCSQNMVHFCSSTPSFLISLLEGTFPINRYHVLSTVLKNCHPNALLYLNLLAPLATSTSISNDIAKVNCIKVLYLDIHAFWMILIIWFVPATFIARKVKPIVSVGWDDTAMNIFVPLVLPNDLVDRESPELLKVILQ